MAENLNPIKAKPRAVGSRILVSEMNFGEQVTKSGVIILSDNGKAHGVHPRWGKVYSKGPRNNDPYTVGNWVLIEHGRWTRGISVQDGDDEITLRMVDEEAVIGWSEEEPSGELLGG